jgi:hypothetical protein
MKSALPILLLAGAALLVWAPAAGAQCSMCQTALLNSAEGRGIGQEFNRAILVMLFAPYVVFGSVGAVLLRHHIARSVRSWMARLGLRRLDARLTPVEDPQVH